MIDKLPVVLKNVQPGNRNGRKLLARERRGPAKPRMVGVKQFVLSQEKSLFLFRRWPGRQKVVSCGMAGQPGRDFFLGARFDAERGAELPQTHLFPIGGFQASHPLSLP